MRTSVMSRPFTARNRAHTSIEFIMADENCNFKSYGGLPKQVGNFPWCAIPPPKRIPALRKRFDPLSAVVRKLRGLRTPNPIFKGHPLKN
jgi:hypothetical protein